MNKNILVAYFSCGGATEKAAKRLATAVGADLYSIQPAIPYTAADLDWTDKKSRSSVETSNPEFRPQIANRVENIAQYDTVFIGFPIWWYVAPTIINTFLESYDFAGKTLIPFATSGGSGMGKTENILSSICSDKAIWKKGKLLNGNISEDALIKWAALLGLKNN